MNLVPPRASDNLKNPLEKFRLRAEVRALLWQANEMSLADAVDELVPFARALGIDTDLAQLIMGRAFAAVRDDLGGWRP